MPYLNKKRLYEFEKSAFLAGLNFGYAVDHRHISKSEELMWQYYKKEITTDEWEKEIEKLDKIQ